MDRSTINTELDFLDELTPLSAPLVDIPTMPPLAYTDLPMGRFIIILIQLLVSKVLRQGI